jgi:hypothetical protein
VDKETFLLLEKWVESYFNIERSKKLSNHDVHDAVERKNLFRTLIMKRIEEQTNDSK